MSTRREFLTGALAGGAAAALAPRRASAAIKSMTVVHESSFIKAFDDFFVKTLSPEYEKLTGIKVGYEAVSGPGWWPTCGARSSSGRPPPSCSRCWRPAWCREARPRSTGGSAP